MRSSIVLLLLCLPPAASALEGGPFVPSHIEEQLRDADRLAAEGKWEPVVRIYREILDLPAAVPVAGGPDRYRPSRELCVERILALPAEGRETYERMVRPVATRERETASRRRDPAALASLADRYPIVLPRVDLLHEAGILRMDRGAYPLAAAAFDRSGAPDDIARLVARIGAGRDTAARRMLPPVAPSGPTRIDRLREAGWDPIDRIDRIRREALPAWTCQGGNPARDGFVSDLPEGNRLETVWTTPFPWPFPHAGVAANRIAPAWIRYFSLPHGLPVYDGETLYVPSLEDILAVDPATGEPRWTFRSAYEAAHEAEGEPTTTYLGTRRRLGIDHRVYVGEPLALADGRILRGFTAYPVARASQDAEGRLITLSLPRGGDLAALGAADGTAIWESANGIDMFEPNAVLASTIAPLPCPEGLLAAEVHVVQRMVWLSLRDPDDGTSRWSVPAYMERTQEVPPALAVADGQAFLQANTGWILCFRSRDGSFAWARRYERGIEPFNTPYGFDEAPGVDPLRLGWFKSFPVCTGGVLLAAPLDGTELLALDPADGNLLWKRPAPGGGEVLSVFLGASHGEAVTAGAFVEGLDIATGETRWRSGPISPVTGRGILTEGTVLVPTDEGVVVVDRAGGAIRRTWLLPENRKPGNLMVAGRFLISVDREGVSAYRVVTDGEGE